MSVKCIFLVSVVVMGVIFHTFFLGAVNNIRPITNQLSAPAGNEAPNNIFESLIRRSLDSANWTDIHQRDYQELSAPLTSTKESVRQTDLMKHCLQRLRRSSLSASNIMLLFSTYRRKHIFVQFALKTWAAVFGASIVFTDVIGTEVQNTSKVLWIERGRCGCERFISPLIFITQAKLPGIRWVIQMEDDVLLYVPNVLRTLAFFNSSKPYWISPSGGCSARHGLEDDVVGHFRPPCLNQDSCGGRKRCLSRGLQSCPDGQWKIHLGVGWAAFSLSFLQTKGLREHLGSCLNLSELVLPSENTKHLQNSTAFQKYGVYDPWCDQFMLTHPGGGACDLVSGDCLFSFGVAATGLNLMRPVTISGPRLNEFNYWTKQIRVTIPKCLEECFSDACRERCVAQFPSKSASNTLAVHYTGSWNRRTEGETLLLLKELYEGGRQLFNLSRRFMQPNIANRAVCTRLTADVKATCIVDKPLQVRVGFRQRKSINFVAG